MAIFKNSRYSNTYMYNRDGVKTFKTRDVIKYNLKDSVIHVFLEGETLDGLANHYYEDAQLWWVLVEANPHITNLLEIPYGIELVIPSIERVVSQFE